ncbi:MAG: hypothetical protein WBG38_10185 [Nodosilinea sp.]
MVHNLAKSPLAWSIGGVGAIALVMIGVAYLGQSIPSASTPELELAPSTSPWQQGTELGWQAAVAAQDAQFQTDWQRVSDLWGQAIAALESVPANDPNYAQAQTKAAEYRDNQAIAKNRLAAAGADSTSTRDLQTALATAEPAFTFAPGPAATTVGRSADGLATVELSGSQATLVLPRLGDELTMAQVVYARQFVALTAPDATGQPWLLEGLRAAQSDRPPLMPADAPVTLSAGSDTLSIAVTTAP